MVIGINADSASPWGDAGARTDIEMSNASVLATGNVRCYLPLRCCLCRATSRRCNALI